MHTFDSLKFSQYFILLLIIFDTNSRTAARYLTNSTTATTNVVIGNSTNEDKRVDIVGDIFVDEFTLAQPSALPGEESKMSTLTRVLQKVSAWTF
ncbi:hypothetical protein Y032_0304g1926 [Ancylostoma ceylanicum]|uniref:Uncharacterized protein n=1 Tax=Ancylostoma ceylanicum TaxID=53326 RepID=A0A016S3U4_9BILA|nr:hypothetical protein Y032_0304g1926 [Ancylostoma ceylanicum]